MATKAELIKQEVDMIKDVTLGPLQQASVAFSNYLPQLIGAIVILIVGWLVAMILRKFSGKLLRAIGLDVVAERVGMTELIQRGGMVKRPSEIIGWFLYWLILFSTLVATFNTLGLEMASVLLQSIVTYIPSLLIALLLLGVGFFASRYIEKLITATASTFELPVPEAWGRAAQGLIIFITVVMSLGELGISTRIVNLSFLVLLAVAGIAAAIAFGLGTRQVVEQLAAGQSLRQWLHTGDQIEYDGQHATIVTIGSTHINLRLDHGIVSIPNTVMLTTTIVKPTQSNLQKEATSPPVK